MLTLYHLKPSSSNLYWPSTSQYRHILIQYHQVPLLIHHLDSHSSANWIISLFTTHLMSHAQYTWSSSYDVFQIIPVLEYQIVWWKRQIWYSLAIYFCRPLAGTRPPACWFIFLFILLFLSSSAIVVKVVCIVASLFTVPVVAVEACLGNSFWIGCYVILVISKCWNLLFLIGL